MNYVYLYLVLSVMSKVFFDNDSSVAFDVLLHSDAFSPL